MFIRDAKLNFIDIFAGAGGLSEGFFQEGFNPIAHVEMNSEACKTLETRSAYYYLKKHNNLKLYYRYLRGNITREDFMGHIPGDVLQTVIQAEMSSKNINDLFARIDGIMAQDKVDHVDVLVGGPPCQAYSLVGRAQSSHMHNPMSQDPRNNLYRLYARFLTHYQPTMFVFENVMGIESANGGQTLKNIKKYLRRVGYSLDCREQNSYNFGVLQNRRRMIIVGWKKGSGLRYPEFDITRANAIVSDLLQDLPKLLPGQKGHRYGKNRPSDYVINNQIRTDDDVLTLHQSRPHMGQDIEIYKMAIRQWDSSHDRLNYADLPERLRSHNNVTSFLDRFKVVEGDQPYCHTVLAHLSKDGHYFIHPDIHQHRSITVREAARIQSFPDNYFFEGGRTSQFVQVGNAVPPMMAKAIAEKIKELLLEEDNGAGYIS